MTSQNDRQDRSLTGQVRDQARTVSVDRPLFSALLFASFLDKVWYLQILKKLCVE